MFGVVVWYVSVTIFGMPWHVWECVLVCLLGMVRYIWSWFLYALGICSGMTQCGLFETVEVYAFVWYGMFWLFACLGIGLSTFWLRDVLDTLRHASRCSAMFWSPLLFYADFGRVPLLKNLGSFWMLRLALACLVSSAFGANVFFCLISFGMFWHVRLFFGMLWQVFLL